ncbi:MAG: hypothetical protein LBB08_02905 [Rickettsiales bacterium]|jgi:hypothetical protein|nr:hypothetical protein [Rickettsiales bacterium]
MLLVTAQMDYNADAMNIFMLLLMALMMAGYYLLDAPHATTGETRAEAIEAAELGAVLSCMLHAHSDALAIDEASGIEQKAEVKAALPCAEKYEIQTQKLCADEKRIVSKCVPDKANASVSNYLITSSGAITDAGAGRILELLGRDYPYAANFGIISMGEDKTPQLLSSGGTRREISKAIAREAKFEDGELVYMTQYSVSGKKNPVALRKIEKIRCGKNEVAIFRQNSWQCAATNFAPICSGDFIWSADRQECIADNSRRPLCRSNQSAILKDNIWECVDSAPAKECPDGAAAEMNYDSMEWECPTTKPEAQSGNMKKCGKIHGAVSGGGTTTLHGSLIGCNDCEKMVVHDDCSAECVPNAAAASSKACYGGGCKSFYFGFPSAKYIEVARKNIPELSGENIQLDSSRSRNRRFNCAECPNGIDGLASMQPYIVKCK